MSEGSKKKKTTTFKKEKSETQSVKSKNEKPEPPPEDQVEVVPEKNPETLPPPLPQITPPQPQFRLCVHHKVPFQYFCETCEDPICQQCTVMGPHNTQLHRISRVSDAFKLRCARIEESIKVNLLAKREQLLAQIERVEYRAEEVKYVKAIIERDIRAEFGGVLERLKHSEGQKLAILHHEIAELQKDLDQINEIGSQFYDLKDLHDPSPFLMRSRQIYENIEYAVAKPLKIQIEVYPSELPRELTELRLLLQRGKAAEQLLVQKNEIIWKLVNERGRNEEMLKEELEKQASEEINEWSKLVDNYSIKLKNYQLVCFYCGCKMEKQYVNSVCTQNRGEQDLDKVFCKEQPPSNHNGTGRHFFAEPIL